MRMNCDDFSNEITNLCYKKFDCLPKRGKPNENEWTVLSCIVVEYANKQLEVVALGTGSKCIGQDMLSANGDILNDSHAEIMCRRAFIRYIYENMLHVHQSTILKFKPEIKKFQLKQDIKIHFLTTHVPCGDAAIFPKHDTVDIGKILSQDDPPNTLKRTNSEHCEDLERKRLKLENNIAGDIFRTGAKCLKGDQVQDLKHKGAEYHVVGVVRTKPGRGVPTLSVSCSDKIAKWCHLGMQGALLSILLDRPIYLSSFIVAGGTPYNREALERAFYGRLENVTLEAPFGTNPPALFQANSTFCYSKSEGKNPCASSVAWLKGFSKEGDLLEVSVAGRRQGVTKKHLNSDVSRLKICKLEFYKYFVEVLRKFEIQLKVTKDLNELTYGDAKLCAEKYQRQWTSVKNSFKIWSSKSDSLLSFSCV